MLASEAREGTSGILLKAYRASIWTSVYMSGLLS